MLFLLCNSFQAVKSTNIFFISFVIFYAQAYWKTMRLIIMREYIQINKKTTQCVHQREYM